MSPGEGTRGLAGAGLPAGLRPAGRGATGSQGACRGIFAGVAVSVARGAPGPERPPGPPRGGDDESDDGDHDVRLAQHESDDENLYADPPQTTIASHSRSRSRTPPPAPHHTRKRRRRHTTRPSNSSASRPSISRTTSSAGDDADAPTDRETRFEKELLTELTCMICFAPMWKPITTPCQHVSVPFISRWPYLFLPHRIICDPMW